jgi:hypothetical protein
MDLAINFLEMEVPDGWDWHPLFSIFFFGL